MKLPEEISELAAQLGEVLSRTGQTVATAESCTGGGVAQAIISIPGSSGWFEYGVVTYSNTMKTKVLGVSEATLSAKGAVNEAVVTTMVKGLLRHTSAGIGVAISGVAGPEGGTPDKPVGTVCFGWGAPGSIQSATQHFSGDRDAVREQSVAYALRQLIELAKKSTV